MSEPTTSDRDREVALSNEILRVEYGISEISVYIETQEQLLGLYPKVDDIASPYAPNFSLLSLREFVRLALAGSRWANENLTAPKSDVRKTSYLGDQLRDLAEVIANKDMQAIDEWLVFAHQFHWSGEGELIERLEIESEIEALDNEDDEDEE